MPRSLHRRRQRARIEPGGTQQEHHGQGPGQQTQPQSRQPPAATGRLSHPPTLASRPRATRTDTLRRTSTSPHPAGPGPGCSALRGARRRPSRPAPQPGAWATSASRIGMHSRGAEGGRHAHKPGPARADGARTPGGPSPARQRGTNCTGCGRSIGASGVVRAERAQIGPTGAHPRCHARSPSRSERSAAHNAVAPAVRGRPALRKSSLRLRQHPH
jgi:hypothetical protein